MSAIKEFLELNRKNKLSIAVVGDVMVDEYYYVQSNRLSPEFPIPVMLSKTLKPTYSRPGGAANVAYQFKHFNADVCLFSFLDKWSTAVFKANGINCSMPCREKNFLNIPESRVEQVPIKRRLYHGDFPLCRWDIEIENYGCNAPRLEFIHDWLHAEHARSNPQITILSDYNKGFFTDFTRKLWLGGVTVVDPKKGPASNWRGCTIFKPNSKEAEEMSGFKDWKAQADYFMTETQCKVCAITQGGEGVVGKTSEGYFEYRPRNAVAANSVIGAGDCFITVLTMAYAHGMPIEKAVEVAFEAGAIYVQNKHNEPISPSDLLSHDDPISAKFIEPESLNKRDFSLVFTNGCFDGGLTGGHIECLRFAKAQGDKLVVALNSDESIRKLKDKPENGRPLVTLQERMKIIAALACVDYVVYFDDSTPLSIIQQIRPDIIVKGGEYKVEEVVGYGLAGIEIRLCPLYECPSTTGREAAKAEANDRVSKLSNEFTKEMTKIIGVNKEASEVCSQLAKASEVCSQLAKASEMFSQFGKASEVCSQLAKQRYSLEAFKNWMAKNDDVLKPIEDQ